MPTHQLLVFTFNKARKRSGKLCIRIKDEFPSQNDVNLKEMLFSYNLLYCAMSVMTFHMAKSVCAT